MTVNFRGYVFNDAGTAVSGASVKLLETGTTTQEGSTVTTDSNGLWYFNEADQDRYDVEITSGTSVRRIRWNDEISLKEIDVRNNVDENTPAATFSNLTNNAANQVAIFRGANSTRADNDEIYISFELADSGGDLDEFARISAVATDVTAGSEDGALVFYVADTDSSGDLQEAFRIASSTGGTISQTFTSDSITFGSGSDTDIVLNFNANTADGVLTWMEDEDYFQFSDDILMSTTERINLRDTAIYIYSSADGQLDLVADTEIQIAATTIDINGAVALNGAITGATDITLSGELDAATLDISGNADIDGTLEADAYTVDGVTLAEYISDTTGAMFSSNTETGLAATYQDGDNTIDLAVSAAQTTITSLLATDIKIGEDDQTKIDFEDANTINFYANNAKEVVLAENSISPGTSDGTALGTTSLMWSDLFLASGSVINFNNGDMTLTHSSNTLTAAGGTVATAALTTSTIVASGIIKTDDATEATSTTDGSLQTDGGLSVVKDAVFGDDMFLLSDSAVLNMGAGNDFTITHDGTTGATIAGNPVTITSGGAATWSTSSGDLTLTAASEINLTKGGETLVRVSDTSNSVTTTIIAGTSIGAIGTTTAHNFQIWQGGDNRLVVSSNGATWQFQQATTLSNSSGDISLEPADDLIVVNGKNLKIGGTADNADVEGTNKLSIFNGTAPEGTLTNGATIYCASGQMRILQANDTDTALSPHNPNTGEWWFDSKTPSKRLVVHMERLVKKLASKFPDDFSEFIEEYTEEI